MKKPAQGIMPQWLWQTEMVKKYGEGVIIDMHDINERYKELKACIKRRLDNEDSLLQQWIDEYNYLTHMIYKWETEGVKE